MSWGGQNEVNPYVVLADQHILTQLAAAIVHAGAVERVPNGAIETARLIKASGEFQLGIGPGNAPTVVHVSGRPAIDVVRERLASRAFDYFVEPGNIPANERAVEIVNAERAQRGMPPLTGQMPNMRPDGLSNGMGLPQQPRAIRLEDLMQAEARPQG